MWQRLSQPSLIWFFFRIKLIHLNDLLEEIAFLIRPIRGQETCYTAGRQADRQAGSHNTAFIARYASQKRNQACSSKYDKQNITFKFSYWVIPCMDTKGYNRNTNILRKFCKGTLHTSLSSIPSEQFKPVAAFWHERAAFQSVGVRAVDWQ